MDGRTSKLQIAPIIETGQSLKEQRVNEQTPETKPLKESSPRRSDVPSTPTVKDEALYLYCIGEGATEVSFGNIGIEGGIVYTIPYRDISAVVSDTPLIEYEPNEANALIHEEVVERVMQEHTVIPLGFGNVFIDENRLKWLMAKFYLTFKTYLKKLEGKVEVGVKVFYDLEAAKRELEAEYATEENYYNKINEKAYEYGVMVYEALKKCAEDTHLMKRIGENMIMNGAFLVKKEKIQVFEGELEKLEKENADRGLKFQFSGPWPPYNFARIHIGR